MSNVVCADCGTMWCTCSGHRCPNCSRARVRPTGVSKTSLKRLPWIAALRPPITNDVDTTTPTAPT